MALTSNVRFHSLVLEYYDTLNNKTITEDKLISYLNNSNAIKWYAFKLHDHDFDENGELIRKHYHIVIELFTKRTCETLLSNMASDLMINRNCISISAVRCVKSAVRYLCHEDNKEKTPYDTESAITNDMFTYSDYRNYGNGEDLQLYDLYDICFYSDSLCEVYGKIGLKNSVRYRHIINDMFNEMHKSKRKEK